ncbi:hypothetical protein [Streptomyces sp. NPDC058297]|uniref:hypothetical protein n=1 Tax=Streptomyces sp. NPDC058297 TaxID=3346433 RepID=UPI0036E5B742
MATPEFRPTHVVPPDGLPAWEEPDVSRPTQPLDPLLPVELVDRRADWGRIVCANGWSAWVDGRLLVAVPHDPPEAGKPMARTADPRPLMARVEEAAGQYRRAARELAEERIDGETFRRRTQGLRVGMVVDGEAVWLYDAEHERWVYCDGTQLSTYAAEAGPGRPSAATPAPAHPADPEPAHHSDPEPTGIAGPESTGVAGPTQAGGSGPDENADGPGPGPDKNPTGPGPDETLDGAPPTPNETPTPTPAQTPPPKPPEPTRVVDPGQMTGYDADERERSAQGPGDR